MSCRWLLSVVGLSLLASCLYAGDAAAKSFRFQFRNVSGSPIEFQLYADGRNNIWPSYNQVWSVPADGRTYHYDISCVRGENVCFGAWILGRTDIAYGVGKDNVSRCSDCCFKCTGSRTKVIKLNPPNLAIEPSGESLPSTAPNDEDEDAH
jgi:hypothetical protein